MPSECHNLSLHPHTHLCAHCEDPANPVTIENGVRVLYPAGESLNIEVFLHRDCAEAWKRAFRNWVSESAQVRTLFHT